MSATGFSPGDTVSYRTSIIGEWRDAEVIRVDTSLLLPIIIKDLKSGSKVSAQPEDLI